MSSIDATKIKPIKSHLTGIKQELWGRGGAPRFPLATLECLNSLLWGLHKGLTTIGARSSMGKSAFVLQIARDLADQQIPTMLLSLEMDVNSMIERLFCSFMQVDNFELISGKMSQRLELQQKWHTFEGFASKIPLLLMDGIGKSFAEVNELISILKPKPKVVIVDYIQGIRQSERERLELNEYIRNFRQLMLENDMVGILASQMNRQVSDNIDKRPTLENLKSTGVLEEHSDCCLLLYWDYYYSKDKNKFNNYEIIVAKNRNGKTGIHNLYFYPQFYLFTEEPLDLNTPDLLVKAKEEFGGRLQYKDE